MWMVHLSLTLIFFASNSQNKSTFRLLVDVKKTSFCTERAKCHMCFCAFPFACRSTHVVEMYTPEIFGCYASKMERYVVVID